MGISADRFTGYFFTSPSNRAASCGEKIDIVSLSGLMHHLPRPRFSRHIHLFFRVPRVPGVGNWDRLSIPKPEFATSKSPRLRQLQLTAAPILTSPANVRTLSIQFQPRIPVPHHDPFFSQLDRGLPVSVQPVRRGVTPQQRSQRNPQFNVELLVIRMPQVRRILIAPALGFATQTALE